MTQAATNDLDWLAWVAEGRATEVPAPVIDRLQAAGLVTVIERVTEPRATLELTAAGLAHVRSSDQ